MGRLTTRSTPSVVSVILMSVVLSAFVAGCGGDESSSKVLADAPDKTAADRTFALSLDFEFTGLSSAAQPVNIAAQGAYDVAARSGRITMPLGSLGLPGVTGAVTAELIIVDQVLYLKIPNVAPAAKPWLRIGLDGVGGGPAAAPIEQLGVQDPTAVIEVVRGVSSRVQEVGKERVRDAETTHYRLTVDLARAQENAPASRRTQVDRFVRRIQAPTLPMDAWIDAEGRIRRLDYSAQVPGTTGRVRARIEVFDFGTRVDASPPPPEQVTEAPSVAP